MESMLHDIEFRQSNRSADFIAGVDEAESSQRFINRGRLLHTLFSAIETEKDIDNAISQLVFEGVIGRSETEEEIRNLTQRAFSLPQVKDWYSGTWQLFNECDIIWQENGELRNRRPRPRNDARRCNRGRRLQVRPSPTRNITNRYKGIWNYLSAWDMTPMPSAGICGM